MKYAKVLIGLIIINSSVFANDFNTPVRVGRAWRCGDRLDYDPIISVQTQPIIIRGRYVDSSRDGFYIRPQDYIVLMPNNIGFIGAPRTLPINTSRVPIGRR